MRMTTLSVPGLVLVGCSPPLPAPEPIPNYCLLTEPRSFSHEEFDWRLANAPGNLRYQIEQNETRKAECEE